MNTRIRSAKLATRIGASALIVALSGLAQPAMADIVTSKHNLSASNTGPAGSIKVGAGDANGEICVFCHTPHAADVSTVGVPLWNKRLATGSTYTPYGSTSTTLDGEILPVGATSLPCLSCHDGAQAMDNIINAPGSAGYDITGGGADGQSYTWDPAAVTAGRVNSFGRMTNSSTTLAMLGADLSNDHPIGLQYCGGGPTAAAPTTTCVDPDFKGGTGNPGLQNATVNGRVRFWVDSGTVDSVRQKTDVQLYTRTFAVGDAPSVECASCHDPHGTANPTFLRVSNSGSGLCLTCHVK